MNLLALHTLLAVGWAAVLGHFSLGTLLAGFALGYAVLWLLRPLYGPTDYFRRWWRTLGLFVFFLKELVVSSLRVVWEVMTPGQRSRPGVIALPLDVETPVEITMLANLISLTPGTLSIELSEDRRTLYVHAMFIDDVEALRTEIKSQLEQRILRVFR
jgi:multicomponent Na+:H+ antiporter subunit E